MAFDPPPGYDDALDDAESVPLRPNFHRIKVPEVGWISARKPMPNAVASLAMVGNPKLKLEARAEFMMLFVRNHLDEGELDRVLYRMLTSPTAHPHTIEKIAQAVATWGTARPTSPSSRSR